MNCAAKKYVTATCEYHFGLELIMTTIFQKVLPVWECHYGAVSTDELEKLDQVNDWPPGVAAAVVKRLSRDKQLRQQIRVLLCSLK
jgi:hypothetical protein